MMQLLQQMTQSNQMLTAGMAEQRAQSEAVARALSELGTRRQGVVDVRQVGKPDTLKGNRRATGTKR